MSYKRGDTEGELWESTAWGSVMPGHPQRKGNVG